MAIIFTESKHYRHLYIVKKNIPEVAFILTVGLTIKIAITWEIHATGKRGINPFP